MKRGLTAEEAALWARVAQTVAPLNPPRAPLQALDRRDAGAEGYSPPVPARRASALPQPAAAPPPRAKLREDQRQGLDAGWDRRLARGLVTPDFTLDLHGATLDAAHARLEHGLTQALAQGARVVLLITGRDRPSEERRSRGAIRRKFVDWLAAGPHAGRIAAIRPAHPRHGGAGAVYLVLRRAR